MTQSITALLAAVLLCVIPAHAGEKLKRIAIIKADDVRGENAKWDAFFELSRDKGVKVSAGIIVDSLQDKDAGYVAWLKKLNATGNVEFWNHGWDHKKWITDDKKPVSEFEGTGYEFQKKHYEDAQKLMKAALGTAPAAFGTAFNASDADTIKVLMEDPDNRLFFCSKSEKSYGKIPAPMNLRGESDGTGKPNFEKFKAEYLKSDATFAAIQFHPPYFGDGYLAEYGEILDFLIAEGWTFVVPSEYIRQMTAAGGGKAPVK